MTILARALAVAAVVAVGWLTWHVISPGVITANEFHATLLIGAPALVVVLSASWVGNGRPPVDTRRETPTQRDTERPIRPPWA